MKTEKKVVSPFEFAIATHIDPSAAEVMRPETESERQDRLRKMARDFAERIKVKP